METTTKTIKRSNAMPAITWHFLCMNDVDIELPSGLPPSSSIKVQTTGDTLEGNTDDALDEAIQCMRTVWEATHPALTAEEKAEREAVLAAEADATYGGTAQSAYQVQANALEEMRSFAISPDGGMGDEVDSYLSDTALKRAVIASKPRGTVNAQVIVSAKARCSSIAAIDVVAAQGSTIKLSIVVDSVDGSEIVDANAASAADAPIEPIGVAGTFVRVFASKDASVVIARTQTLDDEFVDLDDMALILDERASVAVRQTTLGAGASYAGLAGDLRGDSARVDVDTHYLGHGDHRLDFNYILRHHGTRSQCNLNANGVLANRSRKTLRGTIDLIRGCKGAEGSEIETVLLVDEAVQNKTIPIILCNEDDVAGNHGATIGHIREEQLFYLASRGLSREAAEAMFVSATLEKAAIEAPDDAARAGVIRLGKRLVPGFADLFDDQDEAYKPVS